jgi:peptidoglycan/LPS O-acetylase OafA/YrhL
MYLQYLSAAPVPASEFWSQFQEDKISRFESMHSMFFQHLIAHLTMLHGVIPNSILPQSAVMFVAPAWSISLEWQFYLVAPLVFWALKSRVGTIVTVASAVLTFTAYHKGLLGNYMYSAFLPAAVGYFAIGIGSRLLIGQIRSFSFDPALFAVVGGAFVIWFMPGFLVPLIWTVFFAYMTFDNDRLDNKVFRAIFTNPVSLSLGRVSYSIYLVHVPAIVIVGYVAVTYFNVGSQAALLATHGISIALAIAASYALYSFIEKPGIEFGNRLAYGSRKDKTHAERQLSWQV